MISDYNHSILDSEWFQLNSTIHHLPISLWRIQESDDIVQTRLYQQLPIFCLFLFLLWVFLLIFVVSLFGHVVAGSGFVCLDTLRAIQLSISDGLTVSSVECCFLSLLGVLCSREWKDWTTAVDIRKE